MKSLTIIFAALVCFATPAYADFGDFALGGNLGVGYTEIHNDLVDEHHDTARVFANPEFALRVGLFDWLHFDMLLGSFLSSSSFNPHLSLGFTAAYDVWTIVPELTLGGFVVMGDNGSGFGAGLSGGLGFRYHIDPKWSVALGSELNLGFPSWFQGTASFLYVVN